MRLVVAARSATRVCPTRALDPQLARRLAVGLGALRALLGITALAVPALPAAPWVGPDEAKRPAVRLFARTLGGRDLALGLGAVMAARDGAPVRGWVEAGALADAGDTAATVLGFGELPRRSRWLVLGLTVGAAVAGAVLAPFVDRATS
ncbi:MAG TPA: hypothetical protein VMU75_05240 [Acidimicrobiales bacterium]|nr:hypothetical protein [Acidimicrobiales bacterium]